MLEQSVATSDPALQHEMHSLYSSHHCWLNKWLRHKLGDASDAADLAHDTFVRVIVFRQTHPLGKEPRAFLTCVAKGLVVDHWRRQEIRRAYLDAISHLPEPDVPSPETSLSILETLFQIDKILRGMPARTREIFLLAQLDGLTYREIAERTDIPLVTVKRHMRKAFIACLSVNGI
jgi:RNA polymerase sigma-70 factor (ECF subfamily)